MSSSSQDSLRIKRVFIDTEFTDFINCDLISIGAVTTDGEIFYGENTDFLKPWASTWVKENIYPILKGGLYDMSRRELSARFWSWLEELDCDSVIISYDYKTDYELMVDLFNEDKHQKIVAHENIRNNIYYSCDEMTKVLGGNDYDKMVARVMSVFENAIEEYFQTPGKIRHVAIDDACANRHAYHRVCNEFGIRR